MGHDRRAEPEFPKCRDRNMNAMRSRVGPHPLPAPTDFEKMLDAAGRIGFRLSGFYERQKNESQAGAASEIRTLARRFEPRSIRGKAQALARWRGLESS